MKNLLSITFFYALILLEGCASSSSFFDGTLEGKFKVHDMNNVCMRTGIDDIGVQCVRVWANEKKRDRAFGLAKKYAVSAVLLKGVSGNQSSVKEPLLSYAKQKEFNKWVHDFFKSGSYLTYLDQAEIEPNEVFVIKGGYRVGINAKVNYKKLIQRLIDDGILKKPQF